MQAPDWRQLEALLETALRLPRNERNGYVDRVCAKDSALRKEVLELLVASDSAGSVLDASIDSLADDRPIDLLTPSVAPPSPQSFPRQIGHYRVLSILGEGGMSTVYRASQEDGGFRRQVALKLLRLPAPTAQWLERFRSERRFLGGLDHPNIARLLDAGTTDEGLPFLVLELIEGETIDLYCRQEGLAVEERIRLFLGVCAAVHYSHQNLVVHRDIKPGNLLVTREGLVKLLDFGIAKFLNPNLQPGGSPATRSWNRFLTPEYASPEQLQGRPITTATDVYSLAAVLYALVTDRLPYLPATLEGEQQVHGAEVGPPVRPSEILWEVSSNGRAHRWSRRQGGDLDAILLKALRPEPSQRYGSVEALAEDLERLLAGRAVHARSGSMAYRVGQTLRRHRGKAAAAVAFLAMILMLLIVVGIQANRIAHERDLAVHARDRAHQLAMFIGEVFSLSDPLATPVSSSRAGDGQISLREVVDHGAQRVRADWKEQPLLQADLFHQLGSAYQNLGHFSEAVALFEEEVELRQSSPPEDPSLLFDGIDSLAEAHFHAGGYESSEALYGQSLDLRREAGSSDAGTRVGLARLFQASGRPKEALTEAILVSESLVPDRRRNVDLLSTALDVRSAALRDLGRGDEAESLQRRRLAITVSFYGRDHPSSTLSRVDLADLLWFLGRLDEAKVLYPSAFEQLRQQFPRHHPAFMESISKYGLFLQAIEDFEEAEKMHLEAFDATLAAYGETHYQAMVCLNNLGSLASHRGRFAKAAAYYSRALPTARTVLGPDHMGLAYLLSGLGHAKAKTGEPGRAEELLREALAIRRRLLPDDDWLIAYTEAALARSLLLQERFGEAEELGQRAYQTVVAGRGVYSREAQTVARVIEELYRSWGRAQPTVWPPQRATIQVKDPASEVRSDFATDPR